VLSDNMTATGLSRLPAFDPSVPPLGNETELSDEFREVRISLIIVLGCIFAVMTTAGNFMVMLSFKIDRQLQTISNYFLFSLAVADITIGIISIPMYTYYRANGDWELGRTTKKALTMIACTYIISLILWPPWIISWPYIEGKFTVAPETCVVQFLETNPYVTAVAVVDDQTSVTSSFYLKRKGSAPHSTVVEDSTSLGTGSPRNGSRYRTRNQQPDRPQVDTYTVLIELKDEGTRPSVRLSSCDSGAYDEISCTRNSSHRGRSRSEVEATMCEEKKLASIKESPVPARNGKSTLSSKTKEQEQRKSEKERKKNERKQESKAAKTLSAILFAFIVTWTPYNVIVCWEAFYPRTVPSILYDFAYCLCYINSTINPLCYALCNARFRHTYMRILRCRFGHDRPQHMNQAYVRRT
ncbi:unnamed protein product, partial [Mesorhabditis spiculigera]